MDSNICEAIDKMLEVIPLNCFQYRDELAGIWQDAFSCTKNSKIHWLRLSAFVAANFNVPPGHEWEKKVLNIIKEYSGVTDNLPGKKTHREKLLDRLKTTPLKERLEECKKMVERMCVEGRHAPVEFQVFFDDEDFYITNTINDALALVEKVKNFCEC